MKQIALVADDYTGAGDAAIPFVEVGVPMSLLIPAADPATVRRPAGESVAVDSETRFLDPARAAEQVGAIFAACRRDGADFFYKKTDSVLRGNPGSETEAALAATGTRAALFCSAIPSMGRTCRDGVMYMDGVPLAESEVGRDQFTPLVSSRVADILGKQTELPVGALPLSVIRQGVGPASAAVRAMVASGARILIADAESDGDLGCLATMVMDNGELLPAGASGLSRMLASLMTAGTPAVKADCAMRGRMLAVIGSLTSTARAQADHAEAGGTFGRVVLSTGAAARNAEKELARVAGLARSCGKPNLILTTDSSDGGYDKDSGLRVAALLGRAVNDMVKHFDIVYSTGGSTSVAVAEALGLDRIRLQCEPLPGVVQGIFDLGGRRRWFVSKSGSFGDHTTLSAMLAFIKDD